MTTDLPFRKLALGVDRFPAAPLLFVSSLPPFILARMHPSRSVPIKTLETPFAVGPKKATMCYIHPSNTRLQMTRSSPPGLPKSSITLPGQLLRNSPLSATLHPMSSRRLQTQLLLNIELTLRAGDRGFAAGCREG